MKVASKRFCVKASLYTRTALIGFRAATAEGLPNKNIPRFELPAQFGAVHFTGDFILIFVYKSHLAVGRVYAEFIFDAVEIDLYFVFEISA